MTEIKDRVAEALYHLKELEKTPTGLSTAQFLAVKEASRELERKFVEEVKKEAKAFLFRHVRTDSFREELRNIFEDQVLSRYDHSKYDDLAVEDGELKDLTSKFTNSLMEKING